MDTFETTATVEDQGQLHLAGVPFTAGTQVAITIQPVPNGEIAVAATINRATRLFSALDKSRNTDSVGPLRREELYDRNILR